LARRPEWGNNAVIMVIGRRAIASAAAVLLVAAGPGRAALGGDETSIQADRIRLKGAVSTRQMPQFAMHDIAPPGGASVRQYVSPAGKVFAVAWQGPAMPDLRQLLGPHFDRYVAAAKDKRVKRAPVVIRESTLVLVSGGHPRAFSGRAYVPDLVPQDVDADALP
jgi:hypothetical protein